MYRTREDERRDDMMRRLVASNDPDEVQRLSTEIQNMNADMYPSSTFIHNMDRVLRSEDDQLRAAGAGRPFDMGRCVREHAVTSNSTDGKGTVFEQCFTAPVVAETFMLQALDDCRRYMPDGGIVLPPLLARTSKRGASAYRFSDGLMSVSRSHRPDLIFTFYRRGPIVPIVRRTSIETVAPFIDRVYTAEGFYDDKRLHDFLWSMAKPRRRRR